MKEFVVYLTGQSFGFICPEEKEEEFRSYISEWPKLFTNDKAVTFYQNDKVVLIHKGNFLGLELRDLKESDIDPRELQKQMIKFLTKQNEGDDEPWRESL